MGTPVRRKVFFRFLVLVIMWLVTAAAARAANLNATPSLALSASWDSNIFNTELDEQSDYVFRAAPRLNLSLEGATTRGELIGGIEGEKYADHDELDNADATKSVELRLTRTGARTTITPSARYVETNDVTRRDVFALEAAATPEPGFVPAEALITQRIRSKTYSGALQVSYALSPNLAMGVGGSAMRREFSDSAPGLTGSRAVTGNASLTHAFTARVSGGLSFDTSYNSFDDAGNSRTYTGGLQATYRMSERTTLSASAGATLLRESIGIGEETDEEWSPTGTASVAYVNQDFQASLLGSYVVAGGGSFGETTERGTVSISLADRVSPRWSWNLSGSYQRNRSADGQTATGVDIDSASGGAGVRYQAASWASVGLSGNVYRQRSGSPVGDDVDRETALLDLTLTDTFRLF